MSPSDDQILETLETEIRNQVLTTSLRKRIIALAQDTDYDLQDRDWRLLGDLYAFKQADPMAEDIPTEAADAAVWRMIKARATICDHIFWHATHFQLFGFYQDDAEAYYPQEALNQIKDRIFGAIFTEFRNFAESVTYDIEDDDIYVLIELSAYARYNRLDEDKPRLNQAGAWAIVNASASQPAHPFWIGLINLNFVEE